jgi:hypothetical protein
MAGAQPCGGVCHCAPIQPAPAGALADMTPPTQPVANEARPQGLDCPSGLATWQGQASLREPRSPLRPRPYPSKNSSMSLGRRTPRLGSKHTPGSPSLVWTIAGRSSLEFTAMARTRRGPSQPKRLATRCWRRRTHTQLLRFGPISADAAKVHYSAHWHHRRIFDECQRLRDGLLQAAGQKRANHLIGGFHFRFKDRTPEADIHRAVLAIPPRTSSRSPERSTAMLVPPCDVTLVPNQTARS